MSRIGELPQADRALVALCLVQLDHVDEIGAALGIDAVDAVCDAFEMRVAELVREGDGVCRLALDRQALIMTGLLHRHQLALALAKLQRLFEAPVMVGDRPIKLAVRAGVSIASVPLSASGANELLRDAQRALIASRERGQPVIAGDVPPERAMDWSYLGRLSIGLEQDEFVPYFQPIVDCHSGSVVGAELLMRWLSIDHGLVMPARFIPLVERSDLIRPLTWHALKSGVAHASRWPGELSVSVNVAAATLDDDEIVHVVGDALGVHGLQPSRLVIEVTESGIMHQYAVVADVLTALRRLGVRVAIDDFGTGYSSFAHFRHVPADELKIDRSFVSHLNETTDEQLVRSMIDLAHNLNLRVVAEGVEDQWTADHLALLGCDRLQGFYFGRPVPHDRFLQQLALPVAQ